MNIEKIFSLSFKIFNQTIRFVLPFIVFYTIFLFLVNVDINQIIESEGASLYSAPQLLIIMVMQLLYFILMTQFIFSKINNIKISFNLKLVIESLFKIIGLYILVLIPPFLIINFFMSFNSSAFFLFGIIPILLFITIFSNYLIISKQNKIIESITGSYNIVKNNLNETLILVMANIVFLFFIIIITAIGQLISLLLSSILVNILGYLISIFNIQFYYSITSSNNYE